MKSSNLGVAVSSKETAASITYERLRNDIISVSLLPGTKLRLRSLCQRFDTGLSPMREALSRLSSEGLVTQSDHRGFTVVPLSESDLADITMMRGWLNEFAIRRSIANGDAVWEENVVLSFHRLLRTPRNTSDAQGLSERNPAWEQAHRSFHASLISACGSELLLGYCEQLFDSAERYRHVARRAGLAQAANEDGHRVIMEAVVARDADRAGILIKAHFERTASFARQIVLLEDDALRTAPRAHQRAVGS